MRVYLEALLSWFRQATISSSLLLACLVLNTNAAYLPISTEHLPSVTSTQGLLLKGQGLRGRAESLSSTSTIGADLVSVTAGPAIPLWGKCGVVPDRPCAGDARCIYKDEWWSQCRIPMDGSWIPLNETDLWSSTGPDVSSTAWVLPLLPTVTSSIISVDAINSSTLTKTPDSPSVSAVNPTSHLVQISSSSAFQFPDKSSVVPSSQFIGNLTTGRPASPTPAASIGASAYAQPLNASTFAGSKASSTDLIHKPSDQPSSSSTTIANAFPNPSSSSITPNLACPSDSTTKEAVSDHLALQACDPNLRLNNGNFSSTTNSSTTPIVPTAAKVDPDKGGTYLQANSTSDQQSHCHNFAAHQYQVCWEVLNVTGYLLDWVAFNRGKCDDDEMGFADCFLYLEVGAGANCTSFTGRSQCPSPNTKDFMDHPNGAQAYYVAFNIWNIQNWFFTYWMAVDGANGLTSDNVGTIARTLNLPIPKEFPVLDLLAGLAFAFGLLSPSGYAAAIPGLGRKIEGLAAQAPAEYLLRAVQGAPTLSRVLLDKGSLSDSAVQADALSSDLARIVAQLETNIQNGLILVMGNFSTFFDFVNDGFFSTQIENLNTITQNVTLSLNTYIVSQALQDDDVIITRALNTDINALQSNGSVLNYDTGCAGTGYDEWGMCGQWWYDSTNHISYGLESMKAMLNNYTDALESLFNQGITTPELLFMNSQFCADKAGATQGTAPGTSLSTSTGVWDTECISNMKICTWDMNGPDTELEWTDCEREGVWTREGCGAALEIQQVVMPASYIGPYLTVYNNGEVCNSWSKGMGSPNG